MPHGYSSAPRTPPMKLNVLCAATSSLVACVDKRVCRRAGRRVKTLRPALTTARPGLDGRSMARRKSYSFDGRVRRDHCVVFVCLCCCVMGIVSSDTRIAGAGEMTDRPRPSCEHNRGLAVDTACDRFPSLSPQVTRNLTCANRSPQSSPQVLRQEPKSKIRQKVESTR